MSASSCCIINLDTPLVSKQQEQKVHFLLICKNILNATLPVYNFLKRQEKQDHWLYINRNAHLLPQFKMLLKAQKSKNCFYKEFLTCSGLALSIILLLLPRRCPAQPKLPSVTGT